MPVVGPLAKVSIASAAGQCEPAAHFKIVDTGIAHLGDQEIAVVVQIDDAGGGVPVEGVEGPLFLSFDIEMIAHRPDAII